MMVERTHFCSDSKDKFLLALIPFSPNEEMIHICVPLGFPLNSGTWRSHTTIHWSTGVPKWKSTRTVQVNFEENFQGFSWKGLLESSRLTRVFWNLKKGLMSYFQWKGNFPGRRDLYPGADVWCFIFALCVCFPASKGVDILRGLPALLPL